MSRIDLSATAQEKAADAARRVDLNNAVIGQSWVPIARTSRRRSSARSAGSDEESLTFLEESEPNRAPQLGRETALGAVACCGLVNRFLRPGN